MSERYLPLFRKYRPQSFSDIVGQESLVRALTNAIELNRIAQAYLFCGPRGTGKTSSARIFAKSLNCTEGPTASPCQKCPSCIDITNAAGIDVIEIDAATNRGVDDAEDLIAQVHYAPVSGKYKIFIIDEVHMLTPQAFNALLKTFEEPPENVIFILATTEPHKVLETIVSRCQRFDFRRITVDDIQKRLREISDIEKIKITDEALTTIAKNVSGGLRDSLALLDQVSILGAKEEISKEMIEELLGKVTFDRLDTLLETIVNKDIENSLKLIDEIYSKGSEPRNFCENFMEFLRNVIIVLSSKNPHDVIKFSTLAKSDVDKIISKNYELDDCTRILDIAVEYFKEIKFATNPYLWVELMIIKSAQSESAPAPVAAKKPIPVQNPVHEKKVETENKPVPVSAQAPAPEAEEKPAPAPVPKPETAAAPAPPQAPAPAPTGTNELEIFSEIVNAIESVPAKFFYSGMAKLVSIVENKITLGFINQNVITQAKSDTKLNALLAAEKKLYGRYNFDFVQLGGNIKAIEGEIKKPQVQSEPPAKPAIEPAAQKPQEITDAQKPEAKTDEAIKLAVYSPKVKEMLEAFNGKIID